MKLSKNDEIEIEITGMTSEGCGVGRHGGLAVFVPNTIEGEAVRAHIIKVKKNYAVGKCVLITNPSPHRVESACGISNRCGGCAYRHVTYEEECRIKQERVRDAIKRIGGLDIKVNPIVPCEKSDRYRNKAQFPVRMQNGELVIGFFSERTHRAVNVSDCLLQHESFAKIADIFRKWITENGVTVYDESAGRGEIRHVYIRRAHATGEVMVCAVINSKKLTAREELINLLTENVEGLKSVIINYNFENTNVVLGEKCETVWGGDYIEDVLCGVKLRISPLSFYQVNSEQAEKLYALAAKYAGLTGNERIVDVYCGIGSIGLGMANNVRELIGFEIVPDAVKNAKENAKLNGIENAEFFCSDAKDAFKKINGKIDVVILDPPRKGCGEELIADVVKANPDRIVYVSCDSATLARDLARFSALGYETKEITPVDMFPRTHHVETVVLMSKVKE